MSTHNIGFYEDLTKIIFKLSSNIIKYAPYFFCCLLFAYAENSFLMKNLISDVDDKEKVLHQRQMLNKRLGLDMAGNLKLGIDSDIFSDEDLLTGIKQSQQLGKAMDAVSWTLLFYSQNYLSRIVRKPAFGICENKDADQLRGNREADQRLCFHYADSTIPLLPKFEISSL